MRTFKSLMISLCMGTTLCMCLPQTTTAQTVSSGNSPFSQKKEDELISIIKKD